MKLLMFMNVGFDVTHQIFCICQTQEEKFELNESAHKQFIDIKKAYVSIRRELLYSIHIDFHVSMNSVGLIKMCYNETHNEVCIGKHCLTVFVSRMT
jgi:hypothetical protein